MPANEIAAFHVDLTTEGPGAIYYKNEADRTIIQFDNMVRLVDDGIVDFQIILHRDGVIDFEYKNVSDVVDDVTVGVQNASQDNGLTISYGQSYLHSTMAVRITNGTEWFGVSPLQGTAPASGSQAIIVSFNPANLPSGTYTGQLMLSEDAATPVLQSLPVTMTIQQRSQVTITSPTDNFQCLENRDLIISVEAEEEDGPMAKVQFFADNQLLGEVAAPPFAYVWRYPSAGTHVLTARAVDHHNSIALSNSIHVTALANTDADDLPDAWELDQFGNLDQTGNSDFDGDGLTNLEEYANGTDPIDYFNGALPTIVIVEGDHQVGPAGSTLSLPARVRVTDQGGTPLANAPVDFRVERGNGALAGAQGDPVFSIQVRTNELGEASISLIAPETRGTKSIVTAEVRAGDQNAAVSFTERAEAFLETDPETLSFAINLPGTQSQTVVLRNTGPSPLDYICETEALSYQFKDSKSGDGPVYQWEDIGETGTLLSVASQQDDGFEAIDLPYNFPFFGKNYARIYVSSNGFITVGAGASDPNPGFFPGTQAAAGEIAAFHTDLNPPAGGRILYLNAPDHTVVQFDQVEHYDGSGPVTFQIIIDRTGAITFQYQTMSGTLDGAAVGLQNLKQDQGAEASLRNSMSRMVLQFSLPAIIPGWRWRRPMARSMQARPLNLRSPRMARVCWTAITPVCSGPVHRRPI